MHVESPSPTESGAALRPDLLPRSLALIDDDKEYSEFLGQYLRERGTAVSLYADSNVMLSGAEAFSHDFYIVDLTLPGIDGVDLIRILRKRTDAGVLVVSGRVGPDVFKDAITAGADMYLVKPVQFEQVALAIEAVQRRAARQLTPVLPWKLDRRAGELVAPDGARVPLSDIDRSVMESFLEAQGEPVTRETLRQRVARETGNSSDEGLTATIYRLRRRIERATPALVPLQSKSRVGYVFRAPLSAL
jgi:two-component system, OmpR family, response regulator